MKKNHINAQKFLNIFYSIFIFFFLLLLFCFNSKVEAFFWSQTYQPKQSLFSYLVLTQLGKLNNNNPETIQQAIKKLNPSLEQINLEIQEITETTAKVTASKDYLNEITVNFEIKKSLSKVLKKNDLGFLDDNTPDTIIQAVRLSNPSLKNIKLEARHIYIKDNKASVYAPNDYLNGVIVFFNLKKPLSTVITTTQLGKLNNNNPETIQQAIKKLNPSLEQIILEIQEITATTAKVTASKDYLNEITVNFEIKKSLADVITTTQLGKLNNNNPETIQQAIKKLNPSLEQIILEIQEITATTAKVTASKDYLNEITVNFEIKKSLADVITTTQLGKLNNNNPETIQQAIVTRNPAVRNVPINMQEITETTAKVTVPNYYLDEIVEVSFEIKKPLADVITTTQLGKLNNNNPETIQQAIVTRNPAVRNVPINMQEITETTAKVTASKDYLNEITVNFEIKKSLSKVLKKNDLGFLDDNTPDTIIQAVRLSNPSLKNIKLEARHIYIKDNKASVYAPNDYLNGVIVFFNLKKPLSTVITTTQLGKLNNNNPETIQQAIKKLNPSLEQIILEIQEITATTAKVTASKDYLNEITVNFEIKKSLADVITTTQLGKLNNNNPETIQQAIKKLNPSLEQIILEIQEITATTAKVTASKDYLNEITVNFEIKKSLADVITTTQLGKLNNNNPETIQQAIVTRNPAVRNVPINMQEITETTAKVTVPNYYLDEIVEVSFEIKKPLADVITTTQLGKLNNNNPETIQQAIVTRNPAVRNVPINMQEITETTAKVTASKDYLNEITVNFEIKKSLSKVLKKNDLGFLDDNTPDTIIQAVRLSNPSLKNIKLEARHIYIKDNKASVYAPNDYLNGVIVFFNLKKPLSTVITTTQLGKLNNNNPETIQQAIKKLNPSLEQIILEIQEITATTAKVTASKDYLNEITVNFEIKKSLADVITTTQLGKLNNNNPETIQQAIKKLNPSLEQIILEIQEITATTAKVTASKDYLNEITVNFEIKKSLADVITTTQLGKLNNNNPETIQQAIKKLNPSLEQIILEIQEITATTAKVTALKDYLNEITVNFEIKKSLFLNINLFIIVLGIIFILFLFLFLKKMFQNKIKK